MPLQFNNTSLAATPQKDYFGEMMNKAGERDKQQRVQQAMEFIQTGKVSENRSYIQRSLSGNKPLIGSQEEAMNVLAQNAPDIYKDIQNRATKAKESAEKLEVDRKTWFKEDAIDPLRNVIQEVRAIPGDTPEGITARIETATRLYQAVFATAPAQFGFDGQEEFTPDKVSDKSLDEIEQELSVIGRDTATQAEIRTAEAATAKIGDYQTAKNYFRKSTGQNLSPDRYKAIRAVNEAPLDTAEVNQAFKELASTGRIGGQFSDKTKKHMEGITQKEALAREEVGKSGIYDLKSFSKGTETQLGKRQEQFRVKEVAGKTFFYVAEKLEKAISSVGAGSTIGMVGALNRFGAEIGAGYDAITAQAKAMGIKDYDADVRDADLDDFDVSDEVRGYADQSAANKTNLLTLALLFASANGLGEGRALTNKDLQLALDSIGASTGDISQFMARIDESKDNLNQKLTIEAEIYGRDDPWFHSFKGLAEIKRPETQGIPVVSSQEAYDKLKSGEHYMEDGNRFVKP